MTDVTPPWAEPGFVPGSRLGSYRLEGRIGWGGMAVVYRAHDERLDRPVALKVLAPELARDVVFRQRFTRESRAAAAVEDPNIIPVYEAGEADGVLFIAMRLVRGGSVRDLVARHGPVRPDRAVRIITAIASALDSAHESGLVHRDVKPANMLIEPRPGRAGQVYLSDFGISKATLASSGLTGTGNFVGTVDYAAPEQIQGTAVDGRTDQYALGCSAFELLGGHPPFASEQPVTVIYAHLSQPPPSLAARQPGIPPAADRVIARVLAKSPQDRYRSCGEFADALAAALGQGTDSQAEREPGTDQAAGRHDADPRTITRLPGPEPHDPVSPDHPAAVRMPALADTERQAAADATAAETSSAAAAQLDTPASRTGTAKEETSAEGARSLDADPEIPATQPGGLSAASLGAPTTSEPPDSSSAGAQVTMSSSGGESGQQDLIRGADQGHPSHRARRALIGTAVGLTLIAAVVATLLAIPHPHHPNSPAHSITSSTPSRHTHPRHHSSPKPTVSVTVQV